MDSAAVRVERYASEHRSSWDLFVTTAKNGTFLFLRDYMDYHSDRFQDHSLLAFRGSELLGVLPANLTQAGSLVSHQGLTYGGLLVQPSATLCDVLTVFRACLAHLHHHRIERLVYKRIPRHFCQMPDDEIDYALFLVGARLQRRDTALVISRLHRLPFRKGRRYEIRKARRHGVRLVEETDFGSFWQQLLVPRLAGRYEVRPVHSLEEISLLASRHPTRIRQFSAYRGDHILAGTTIYETPSVAHAQYIAVSSEGQSVGALDLLFAWLIEERYADKLYFDFGTCNEDQGRSLNHGLLSWKEGFGARASSHDFHEILTDQFSQLDAVLTKITR